MLVINESLVNKTNNVFCGESEFYEPFTDHLGDLFRSLQKTYGRCTGKVYIDAPDGRSWPVGWVFEKKDKYDDGSGTFIAETWIHYKHVERS